MKKIILAMTILALAGSQVQTAKAGGWPIAAGVFGGLAVGTAIGASVAPAPVYYAPGYYNAPAPVHPNYGYNSYNYCPPVPSVAFRPPVPWAPQVCLPLPGISFGFGFGRPYYRGYGYYGHYGRYYGHGGYYHRGR